jgi:hypothetical protein
MPPPRHQPAALVDRNLVFLDRASISKHVPQMRCRASDGNAPLSHVLVAGVGNSHAKPQDGSPRRRFCPARSCGLKLEQAKMAISMRLCLHPETMSPSSVFTRPDACRCSVANIFNTSGRFSRSFALPSRRVGGNMARTSLPDIEVAIVPSSEAPTGVGEPGVPAVAPAVANAMARLTGKRPSRLPFLRAG